MTNAPEITVSAATSCAVKPKRLPRPKTIKVDGVTIPRDAIARETQNHPASKPVDAWKSAVRALVVRQLLLQEARRRGIEAVPLEDPEGRRETEEEAMVRSLIEAAITTPGTDEASCHRVYEANRARFSSPDIFEVRHILFAAPPPDQQARSGARDKAVAITNELQRDPSVFAELAALHSDCPSSATGGSLGQISTGQTVAEFEDALATLLIGAVAAEPIETRYGFHVVIVDRRIPGVPLPFEMVQPRIAAWLSAKSRHIGIRCFIADLVRQATIEGIDFDLSTP